MDFGQLLSVAKKNAEGTTVRCYSTKFSPPKKESKDKKLSSGIQRFLAQREEEQRRKEQEMREKRAQLEAMRDNKSKNKINKMLKVIKSANKSVVDDAGSPQQQQEPDSDDFGYESQESSALYKRLMEKFKSTEEDKGPSATTSPLKSTKRPPAQPVGKSASANTSTSSSKGSKPTSSSHKSLPASSNGKVGDANKPQATANANKPRRPPPPVVNFEQLLKLAEVKQFEPIKVDVGAKVAAAGKGERPMSAKEKREHEERMRMAEARKRRMEDDNYDYRRDKEGTATAAAAAPGPSKVNGRPPPSAVKKNGPGIRPVSSTATSSATAAKGATSAQQHTPTTNNKVASSGGVGKGNAPSRPLPQASAKENRSVPDRTRQFPPPDVQRTRSFPPEDVQRRPGNSSRPFPPADVRRKGPERPNPYSSRGDYKRPRIEEDDEDERGYGDYDDDEEDEYDSEMDDFIDDGPLDAADVSSCIKEIFGYDKSRYRDEDFDDRDMESSFAQQMKEESYSRKVGRLEDEADMRQEALEKARKAALKRAARR